MAGEEHTMCEHSGRSAERRRHARTPMRMPLRCLRLDPDGRNIVDILETVDISRSGLGVTTGGAYYPGQRLIVAMPLSETQGSRNLYATVVRCRHGDGRKRIGLEFDSASLGSWCGINGVAAAAA